MKANRKPNRKPRGKARRLENLIRRFADEIQAAVLKMLVGGHRLDPEASIREFTRVIQGVCARYPMPHYRIYTKSQTEAERIQNKLERKATPIYLEWVKPGEKGQYVSVNPEPMCDGRGMAFLQQPDVEG